MWKTDRLENHAVSPVSNMYIVGMVELLKDEVHNLLVPNGHIIGVPLKTHLEVVILGNQLID